MPPGENEYKEWQEGYEDLKAEWDENWSDEEKLNHLENMKIYHEQELQGREEAREEWGDEANDGHNERIEHLKNQGQLLEHDIAHAKGEYEYQTERMQDMDEDLRRELERENDEKFEHVKSSHHDKSEQDETGDMDIENDSDEN